MDEKQYKELVEKLGEEAAKKIKAEFEALKGQILTPEQLENKLKELKVDGKSIMIGEKSLEEVLRSQGEDITGLKEKGGEAKAKTFAEELGEKMPEIEKALNSKKGEVVLSIKAAATMTTANTIDESTNTIPNTLIESMSMGAFVGNRYGRQYISDIADRTTISNLPEYHTWLEEGSEQGAFAEVSEGGLKPLMSYDLVRNYATTQKVAGKYVITEEFAKFRAQAYSIIQRLINDKIQRDYNAILTADLNAVAAAYAGTTLDGTITAPNDYDVIGAICAQIETLNFAPDVIILNPQDAWRIRLTKAEDGRYQFPVVTQNGETTIFSLRLVTSTYQTAGDVTIGESKLFKIDEEPLQVRIGMGVTMNGGTAESDFDYNRSRIIVETFFRDYLPTPYIGSFVRTQFSTVKAALAATQE